VKPFTPFTLRIGAPLVQKACWPNTGLATTPLISRVLATFMRYVPLGATADHFAPLYSTDLSQVQFLVNNKIARVANKL
jgi:hypothetical protein